MPKERKALEKDRRAPATHTSSQRERGNVVLISSDRVHFDSDANLLKRSSHAWKRSLLAPCKGSMTLLSFKEPATTIRHFLSFIDPKMKPEPLAKYNIVPLLEMAQKFEVHKVMDAIEKMETDKKGPLRNLCTEDPMFVLSIVKKFCLPKLGSVAMAEAIRAQGDLVRTSEYDIDIITREQVAEECEGRAIWLSRKVSDAFIERLRFEGELPAFDSEPPISQGQPTKQGNSKDPENTRHCKRCSNLITRACDVIEFHIKVEPEWGALLFEMARLLGREVCSQCDSNLRQDVWDELHRLHMAPFAPLRKTRVSAFSTLRVEVMSVESAPVALRSLTSSAAQTS
ncbi:hypothetical protein CPB86DRAFT_781378 [Serendipita vermifera]|nr:hypothetical protein CPB86DRAFT_781378 [Serendipita vermifera]